MTAQTYGQIGDHVPSLLFLWFGYISIVLWVKWTSRRPRVEEEIPPVSLLPRGRRDALSGARAASTSRSGLRPGAIPPERPPFDWNA